MKENDGEDESKEDRQEPPAAADKELSMIRNLVYSILGFEPVPAIAEIKEKKKQEKKKREK